MRLDAAVAERVHARLVANDSDAAVDSLAARVDSLVKEEAPLIGPRDADAVTAAVLAKVSGLGPLEPLFADHSIDEIMVNGPGRVWVERRGALEPIALELDEGTLRHVIEKIVAPLGLRVDRASPIVDARLPDGSRVNVVVPPLSLDGPCVTIRRFGARRLALADFCPGAVAGLLRWAVGVGMNVLVAGGTGAGKTTLLNALAAAIPSSERVVTVEDAAELRLPLDHVVRLEARPANAEGAGRVDLRTLVRNALRMRPDRIVVGEIRGPEALDMLQAMNTGHEGSMSTCHANSPADALRRVETMVLMGGVALPITAVRDQIASSVDFVVQVGRRPGGARAVVEVAEVVDAPGQDWLRRGVVTRPLANPDGVIEAPSRPPRRLDAPRFGATP